MQQPVVSDNETCPTCFLFLVLSLFLLPVLHEVLTTVYVTLSMPGIKVEVTSRCIMWVSLGRMSMSLITVGLSKLALKITLQTARGVGEGHLGLFVSK